VDFESLMLVSFAMQSLHSGGKLASRVGDVLLVKDNGARPHTLKSQRGTRMHKNHLLINAALRIAFSSRSLGTCGAVAGVMGCHPATESYTLKGVAATFLRAQTAVSLRHGATPYMSCQCLAPRLFSVDLCVHGLRSVGDTACSPGAQEDASHRFD